MDLKKEIELNKKILIVLVLIGVITFSLYTSYALFQASVKLDNVVEIHTASELPGPTAVKVLKEKLGTPTYIIGVTNDNEYTTDANADIREYRFSGSIVKNYLYFNCDADVDASTARTKCELWRIIGIFKDENGDEHLKITKEGTIGGFPESYVIGGATYKIMSSDASHAYWNSSDSQGLKNDWATSGLQYWLNTKNDDQNTPGYLSKLKGNTENMIADMKYYLGTVTAETNGLAYINDTPKEAYANERDVEECVENTGESYDKSGCKVWSGNKATWTGKIGLMYPSDYGFSASSGDWDKSMKEFTTKSISWLNSATHPSYNEEYLISPSSYNNSYVTGWRSNYDVWGVSTKESMVYVRPCLYLKSDVTFLDGGEGTKTNPYILDASKYSS